MSCARGAIATRWCARPFTPPCCEGSTRSGAAMTSGRHRAHATARRCERRRARHCGNRRPAGTLRQGTNFARPRSSHHRGRGDVTTPRPRRESSPLRRSGHTRVLDRRRERTTCSRLSFAEKRYVHAFGNVRKRHDHERKRSVALARCRRHHRVGQSPGVPAICFL